MRMKLTEREKQILKFLLNGKTRKEMANELGISENTVKNHCKLLYRRLGVRSNVQAVVKAIREGLVK